MKKTYCLIENGIVTNRAVFDGDMPKGWADKGAKWVASETADIGWSYSRGKFKAPAPVKAKK